MVKNFSFGATSAVLTGLAIIIGLGGEGGSKLVLVTALLIIAIADNISDSFGIQIHHEAHSGSFSESQKVTLINFLTRLGVILLFIGLIFVFPIKYATIFSVILGILILSFLSYNIAKMQKVSIPKTIVRNLLLAVAVMFASSLLRMVIQEMM